jgi:hypothetical protein
MLQSGKWENCTYGLGLDFNSYSTKAACSILTIFV